MAEIVQAEGPNLFVGSVDRRSMGWWCIIGVIASEAALFAYLLFSYYYFAVQSHPGAWPPSGAVTFYLSVPETVVVIVCSLAVWFAERGAQRDNWLIQVASLAVAFVLGLLFIGLQFWEWADKSFSLSSGPYGSLYYVITGFHLVHVVVGVLLLLALLVWSALGYFGPIRHSAISVGVVYWFFIDAIWLCIFFTLYLTPLFG
jgi:heme/copper-type cytochrome/quinol oxidase subunit 3